MTDERPIQYRGAYIGFPNPMPTITTDPTATSDWGLCLSDDWRPAVIGALKVLCRPETWVGTEADIEASMLGGQKILQAIVDGCSGSGVPFSCPFDLSAGPGDWSIHLDATHTPDNEGVWQSGTGFKAETTVQSGTSLIYRVLSVSYTYAAPIVVTSVDAFYSFVLGNIGGPGFGNNLALDLSGSLVAFTGFDPFGHADEVNQHFHINLPGGAAIDRIRFQGVSNYSNIAVGVGTVELYSVDVEGLGTPPTPCG